MPRSTLESRSSSSTSSKRRVSFNKRVEAVHIRHHRDYSKRGFENCWHTSADYEAIKEEVNLTVDHYNNRSQSDIVSDDSTTCSTHDESNFCLRGLENRTVAQKGMKAYLRRAAWRAVLDEQEVQYDLGMPNNSAIMLQEVYSIYSLPAARLAQQRGWEDAKEAGHEMEGELPMAVIAKAPEAPANLSPTTVRRRLAQPNSIVSQAA